MQKHDISMTLQSLAPSDHVVLFYSNIGAKRELVFPFLQETLHKQGVAVYATGHEPLDELREAMKHWGIYVDSYERDRSLIIISHEELTQAELLLNDLRSSQLLDNLMERLMKRGGPIGVVSDPTMLARRGNVDELAEREKALGTRLELPLTLICCYEDTLADTKEGEFLIEILRAHSHVVFPGIALQLA